MSNESDKEGEAIDNVKKLLNIEGKTKDTPQQEKFMFDKNDNLIEESEKNIIIPDDEKVDFKDVMKMFVSDVNETSKANISKAVNSYMKNKDKNKVEIKFNDKDDKILERGKAYNEITKDISKYQEKVKRNREADIVDFTQRDDRTNKKISKKTAKEIATKLNEQNDFEKQIKEALIKNNCETDDKILEKENEELMKINPDELKKRYEELRRVRYLLFQKEIANKRKAKIKSKLFHKINKKRKEKEESELLKQLEQIDPDAVKKYIEKKKGDRIKERMDLKHSINSKFNKIVNRYNLGKDEQVKEAIKENFQLRDKLLQKVKGEDEDDEEEEENEENEEEFEDSEEDKEKNEEGNDSEVVIDFDKKESEEEKNGENNEIKDSGVFSMKFMKNAANKGDDNLNPKIKKLKDDIECDEDFKEEDDEDSDQESSSSNQKKAKKDKKKPNKEETTKPKTITSSDLAQISSNAKDLLKDSNDNSKVKINLNADDLRKILNEENIEQDISQFTQFLAENDTNKKEFLEGESKEQLEKIRKNNPDYVQGWGSWTGDSTQIKAKEYLQKKRYEAKIQKLHQLASENVSKNPFVKVNNSFDKNFSNYLVKELPSNVSNREQFEMLNNHAIGREFNSLTRYKQLIQPKIVKKIGQIIEPMKINDKTTAVKLTEIIEKATKKKVRTKAKL